MACPLLHGNKKKEKDTEKEELIYYEFPDTPSPRLTRILGPEKNRVT